MTYFVEALNLRCGGESNVHRIGECATLSDAIKTAREVIIKSLIAWNHPATTVDELFFQYKRSGELPLIFLENDDRINLIGFNSLSYAREQCEALCSDVQGESFLGRKSPAIALDQAPSCSSF